ncbi:hypothetical protein ACFY3U_11470 [Micromonospora sp. NPDC000089]|uniref:hypothetical protein n=1 Tax=unclassified Micromonospora TaxID=2617518 RepID=UPI0036CF5DF5
MARRCEVSKSALAAAVAGHQLPSERVVRNFVRVCGGDWPSWRRRWGAAAMELAAAAVGGLDAGAGTMADTDAEARTGDGVGRVSGELVPFVARLPARTAYVDVVPPPGDDPGRFATGFVWISAIEGRRPHGPRVWPGVVALVAATAIAALVLVAGLPSVGGRGPAAGPGSVTTPIRIADGTDPAIAGCGADKVVLDSAPVALQSVAMLRGRRLAAGTVVGTITLLFSARCAGAWPWFVPTPGLNPDPNDTTVGILTVEGVRPGDDTGNTWRMGHLDSVYGNLLVTGVGCVQARARVDMVGQDVVATGGTRCLPK